MSLGSFLQGGIPKNGFFPGWAAYLLLGPHAISRSKSALFELVTGSENVRAEQSKAAAAANSVQLNAAGHGMPMTERKRIINITRILLALLSPWMESITK